MEKVRGSSRPLHHRAYVGEENTDGSFASDVSRNFVVALGPEVYSGMLPSFT